MEETTDSISSYWRGACMCLDEKPAPILKSFLQAWHSWRSTPEASRAREISQQKEPGQIRLSIVSTPIKPHTEQTGEVIATQGNISQNCSSDRLGSLSQVLT